MTHGCRPVHNLSDHDRLAERAVSRAVSRAGLRRAGLRRAKPIVFY
jgi:hypothetical protein